MPFPDLRPGRFLAAAILAGGVVTSAASQDLIDAGILDPQPTPQTFDEARLAFGRDIAKGGAQAGGVGMKCMACHGLDGAGGDLAPRLAGLPYDYLVSQIGAFLNGNRDGAIMGPIAAQLTAQEVYAVLAFYARLPEPDIEAPDDLDWQWVTAGEVIAYAGRRSTDGEAVTACIMCHAPVGDMRDHPLAPPLAGQPADYIAAQLNAWRDGKRRGDPLDVMSGIAKSMTEDEIRAVSAYYASVNPAEEN